MFQLGLHFLSALVVSRRCLHIHRATNSRVAQFAAINRIGSHINMVVSCQSEVNAKFVEHLAPAPVLARTAVAAKKPLIVLAHNHIARRVCRGACLAHHLAHPLLRSCKPFVAAHALAVEHHKHGVAITEMIAHAHLAAIAVLGEIVGLIEKLVAQAAIVARHIVVIAHAACPHHAAECRFAIQLLPERPAGAPRCDVAKVQCPVDAAAIACHSFNHLHCFVLTVLQRCIGMKVRYHATLPFGCSSRDETVLGARGVAGRVAYHIAISGVWLKIFQRRSAFGNHGLFHHVGAICRLRVHSGECGAAEFRFGAQSNGVAFIAHCRIFHIIARCRSCPTDAHALRSIFARACHHGAHRLRCRRPTGKHEQHCCQLLFHVYIYLGLINFNRNHVSPKLVVLG